MCYCPTPTLHLNLALTGDGAFLLSPQKTHSVWFISVLNYGDTENVLINHLLLVIPMSYPCHYTNLCPHKPHKHAHTHTHTHTHTHISCCAHSDDLTHSSRGDTHTCGPNRNPIEGHVHAGNDHAHLPRPFEAQNIGLLKTHTHVHTVRSGLSTQKQKQRHTDVADGGELLPSGGFLQQRSGGFRGVRAVIIHSKLGSHQIRPAVNSEHHQLII